MDPRYIKGPVLVGFYGLFEEDYGDPETPTPLCTLTPSRTGAALLPFRCVRCECKVDFSDSSRLECYRDGRDGRGNHFCPACGFRFHVKHDGPVFTGKLDGGGCAPAKVDCPPSYALPRKESPPMSLIGGDVVACLPG